MTQTPKRRTARVAGGFLIATFVGALGCFVGCSTPSDSSSSAPQQVTIPQERILDVKLDGSALKVIGAYVPQSTPTGVQPTPGPGTLDWTFTAADGTTVRGTVADGRTSESEFAPSGTSARAEVSQPWMVFSARVPSTAGTFAVPLTGASVSLGAVTQVSASAPVASDGSTLSPAPSGTDAPPDGVRKLRDSSATCPFNVLIVPEAFTDMGAFRTRAEQVANDIVTSSEYGTYASGFVFWSQDFVSRDGSIFDPGDNRAKSTAFGVSFGSGDPNSAERRIIYPRNALSDETTNRLRTGARYTKADIILIIVNTPEYGGVKSQFLGITYVTVTNNAQGNRVILHEMGHGLLSLADEYTDGTCDRSRVESPNTSARLDALPWKDMVTPSNPLPTPQGTAGVGAFEGAAYCTTGVYRPAHTCLMKELSTGFCPVCARQLRNVFGPRSSGGDAGASDAGGSDSGGGLVNGGDGGGLYNPGGSLVCPTRALF
ncbi:M64 family metallo-endopeptidase [Pendulispora rubella]|uniref:M64 family metallo-endopeptidase n=1 Tax=Pendulispora rubella TaxID=2741070 RepID=A0ABZ2KWT4_9BACT